MWSLPRQNGNGALGGLQARHYSSMPTPLNKTIPSPVNFFSGLCTSFDSIHKISTQKRFTNPNFVNEQNPNIHNYQLAEKCSSIFTTTSRPETNTNTTTQTCEDTSNKENTRRKKEHHHHHRKNAETVKKSPRKMGKGKTKNAINLKYEVDEIGVDALSDSYDSDVTAASPPAADLNLDLADICISIAAIPESKPNSAFFISINTPNISRTRIPSDCGSEDSFVVFQCSPDDICDVLEEEEEEEASDTGTESDIDSDDDSTCSENNFVFEADDTTDCFLRPKVIRKKVRFADDLCVIHPMRCWSYAYQAARKGPWEEFARDRCRFKDRVQGLEAVIGPVLAPTHRQKIFSERFAGN